MIAFPNINPIALQLGPLSIRWYGIAYALGILLALSYLKHLLKSDPRPTTISPKTLDNLIVPVIVGAVVGGRLGFILFYNLDYYLENPLEILMTWRGGMSFHGGLMGVILAVLWYAHRYHIVFFALTDLIVMGAPIGLFLGRIANFINSEHFGRPTDVPWAMVFPGAGPLPRHPSQLYEAFGEGLILWMLLSLAWRFRSWRDNPGHLSGLFLLGYGFIRCFVEFFRHPDHTFVWQNIEVTVGQLLSLPLVLVGVYLLAFYSARKG